MDHKQIAQTEQPDSKTIWANETPMTASQFTFYFRLTRSMRAFHILCATLIARAALRLPIPNQFEWRILRWAMGVVNSEVLR